MTLLSAYFKILSNEGWKPFGKQKVYTNNKEVKGHVHDPIIYFAFAFATDEESEDLLAGVGHKWHNCGSNILKVKELQTFESKTILCLFNIFTNTPKKMVLHEFCEILSKAQAMAQKYEPMDFVVDFNDLPPNSFPPAIKFCQQVPKLPIQDIPLILRKLSWKAQANRKVFHVEYDSCYMMDIKSLTQIAKDANIVKDMWGKHIPILAKWLIKTLP
jgi:hypothetical protein